jgi:AAA15 family ATPase/GTPase
MNEKLIIRNFGPIKDIELELKKFNVLIGEQATGKSTIAKVLAVCKYFSYIVNEGKHYPAVTFEQGLRAWGLNETIQENSLIFYECEHYKITAERLKKPDIVYVPVDGGEQFEHTGFFVELEPISDKFKSLIKAFNELKPKAASAYDVSHLYWRVPTSFFQNDVASVLDNPAYLPTERGLQSIFSLGKNSIQNISDSLFNQLAKLDLIARSFKQDTQIEPLRISYKNIDGKGFIKKTDKQEYFSLYNGASGYQSAIPIILTVKYYHDVNRKPKTFLIEEPELNLFPTTQKELINYLVDSSVNFGCTILLTTHSPYILTSLNNLMYAYEVGKDGPPEKVNDIIEKKYWINPENVSAYRLLPDGTSKTIISKSEDGTLIEAEQIDEVSRELNKEFDELIRLEIENEKRNELS